MALPFLWPPIKSQNESHICLPKVRTHTPTHTHIERDRERARSMITHNILRVLLCCALLPINVGNEEAERSTGRLKGVSGIAHLVNFNANPLMQSKQSWIKSKAHCLSKVIASRRTVCLFVYGDPSLRSTCKKVRPWSFRQTWAPPLYPCRSLYCYTCMCMCVCLCVCCAFIILATF